MENYLNKFCSTKDTKFLNKLDKYTKLILIDTAYSCLYQKLYYNIIEKSPKLLEHGYIKVLRTSGTELFQNHINNSKELV
jgi:hypothetical protein